MSRRRTRSKTMPPSPSVQIRVGEDACVPVSTPEPVLDLEVRAPVPEPPPGGPTAAVPPIDISRAVAIRGWMSPVELAWLAARAAESTRVAEVGCLIGRSTRALGDHVRGMVYAIDPWSAQYFNNDSSVARWFRKLAPSADAMFAAFQANVQDLIDAGRVKPMRLSSIEAAAVVDDSPHTSFDLVFIDGDHRYDAVREDIVAWSPLLRRGGILAGHDYGRADWPGVKQAVDEAFGADVQVVETIWWVRL